MLVSSVSGFLISWLWSEVSPCGLCVFQPHITILHGGISDIYRWGGGNLSVPFSEAQWKPPYSLSPWNGKSRGSSQSFCWGNFWDVYLFSWAFIFFLNIWVALKVPKAFIFITVMNPWYLEGFLNTLDICNLTCTSVYRLLFVFLFFVFVACGAPALHFPLLYREAPLLATGVHAPSQSASYFLLNFLVPHP